MLAGVAFSVAQDKNELKRLYSVALQKERSRSYEQAAINFERLFHLYPANNAYYQGLKRNLVRLERYQLLLTVIEKRLSVLNDVAAHADLGLVLYKQGQIREAQRQWQNTLDRFSTNAMAYIQVAAAQLGEGLVAQAIKTYKRGRKKLGDNAIFAVELANIYAGSDEKAKAAAEYLKYYRKNTRQVRWVEAQILSYLNSSDSLQILMTIRREIEATDPPDLNLLKIYANSLKSMNRRRSAMQTLIKIEEVASKIVRNYRPGEYLSRFAQESYQQEKYEIALSAYTTLQEQWPDSPFNREAFYKAAQIYEKKGDYSAALNQLQAFLANNRQHFNGNYLQGMIYLSDLHQPERAIPVFELLFKSSRTRRQKRQAALALGDAFLQHGDLITSARWYREALGKSETFDVARKNEVYYKLAGVQFVGKKFLQAGQTLAKIKSARGSNNHDDLMNDALEFSFLIADNLADSAAALSRFADYKLFLARNDFKAAESALEDVAQKYPASALAPEALIGLATLYAQQNDEHKQELTLRRFTEKFAESDLMDEACFSLAKILAQTGHSREAAEYLNKILVEYPYSTFLEESRTLLRQLSLVTQ